MKSPKLWTDVLLSCCVASPCHLERSRRSEAIFHSKAILNLEGTTERLKALMCLTIMTYCFNSPASCVLLDLFNIRAVNIFFTISGF